MPYNVDKPIPVPLPSLLVVKDGSKICSSISGSMPIPLSLKESCRYSPGWKPWWSLQYSWFKTIFFVATVICPQFVFKPRRRRCTLRCVCLFCNQGKLSFGRCICLPVTDSDWQCISIIMTPKVRKTVRNVWRGRNFSLKALRKSVLFSVVLSLFHAYPHIQGTIIYIDEIHQSLFGLLRKVLSSGMSFYEVAKVECLKFGLFSQFLHFFSPQ